MNLISTAVTNAAYFISEPFYSLYYYTYTKSILTAPDFEELKPPPKIITEKNKVSTTLESRINELMISLGVDPKKFQLNADENENAISASGSIAQGCIGTISINPLLIKMMQMEPQLRDTEKFILAHEIGHLVRDDHRRGLFNVKLICFEGRLKGYLVVMVPLSFFSPYSILFNHVMSCTAAKVVGLLAEKAKKREQEFEADTWAAKKSPQIAEAGVEFFEGIHQKENEMTQKEYEKLKNQLKASRSISRKMISAVSLLFHKITHHFVAVTLGELCDIHPSMMKRAKNIILLKNASK